MVFFRDILDFQEFVRWQSQMPKMKVRLLFVGFFCLFGFFLLATRLIDVMIVRRVDFSVQCHEQKAINPGDIYDRSGVLLATFLKTTSLYANPRLISNPKEIAHKLAPLLGDNASRIYKKISDKKKSFIWLKRHISPTLEKKTQYLGCPGICTYPDKKRFYPCADLLGHIIGYCDIDGSALGGIERGMKDALKEKSLNLSIDVRIQHIVYEVLKDALSEFSCPAGNAMVLDLKTGEILASVSLPCFDPNHPQKIEKHTLFNRNIMLCSEPGSVLKMLNVVIALESKSAKLTSQFDARCPIYIGRHKISDFRGKNRVLSTAEVFVHSSNIGSIKLEECFGAHVQKTYMERFGITKPVLLETSEKASPLLPKPWNETIAKSISMGYGISITPAQLLAITAALLNGGNKLNLTLLRSPDKSSDLKPSYCAVISPHTSKILKQLMRLVILHGTGHRADIAGYGVFGKTGTAYKSQGKKGYGLVKKRTTTFIGGFPYSDPRYLVLVMLDDPKATPKTHGFQTAGWNATPTAGSIIERIAPLLEASTDTSTRIESVPGWYAKPQMITATAD